MSEIISDQTLSELLSDLEYRPTSIDYPETVKWLVQVITELKQELPLALEHLARLPYGPPFGSRNEPEFHFRQGWDSACAFMYSELSHKWHLNDENVTNKELGNENDN